MNDKCYNILVILAGGTGQRYKSNVPKQYSLIKGREVIDYSLIEMKKSELTDKIIVVLNNDESMLNKISIKYGVDTVIGGKERAYSFQNAIDFIHNNYPECKKVIFHEAARPLVSYKYIDLYFKLLEDYDYVETCTKITDSLGSYIVKAPRREDYYLIQAPEAYKFSVLKQYYDCDSDIYFAANQFPDFIKGYQCFDIANNIKLTKPDDKILIEYFLDTVNKENI